MNFLREWPSGCDYPLSAFPEELLGAFPDAKFVLTKRPAAKWYASIKATICQMHGTWFMDTVKMLPFFPFNRFKAQTPAVDAVTRNKYAPGVAGIQSWGDICQSEELGIGTPPPSSSISVLLLFLLLVLLLLLLLLRLLVPLHLYPKGTVCYGSKCSPGPPFACTHSCDYVRSLERQGGSSHPAGAGTAHIAS